MPDETNGINNCVSCYNKAVQFSGFFVTSLSDFDEISGMAMNLVYFSFGLH